MILTERLFENIVHDLIVDQGSYDYELSQVTRPGRVYVIIFMARSGSSWLTSLLSGTNLLGYPEEYLNPNFVREVARSLNSREQKPFLDILKRRRKTENGVFGLEARAHDIEHFSSTVFFEQFDFNTIFFNLWRKNIILQGVSLFRALETKRWHSYEEVSKEPEPTYNPDMLEKLALQLLSEENDNMTLLRKHGRRARFICYEDIVQNRTGTLQLFSDSLGVTLPADHYEKVTESEHTKIGDYWNQEIEQKFRRDRPIFVANLERARLVWRSMQHLT